jgi:hypothetical protein
MSDIEDISDTAKAIAIVVFEAYNILSNFFDRIFFHVYMVPVPFPISI